MSSPSRDTSKGAIIAGVIVIAIGVWLLMGRALGWAPYFIARYIRLLLSVAGPIAVILLGILVIVAAQRGAFSRSRDLSGKRWYRSRDDRMIGGVLGGLGAYLEFDPTLLRLGYVLVTFVTGFWLGVIAYVVAMVVIPEAPVVSDAPIDANATVAPPAPSAGQAPPPPPPPAP